MIVVFVCCICLFVCCICLLHLFFLYLFVCCISGAYPCQSVSGLVISSDFRDSYRIFETSKVVLFFISLFVCYISLFVCYISLFACFIKTLLAAIIPNTFPFNSFL